MTSESHDEAEIAAAIERLQEGDRLHRAEAAVAAAAPALQHVLAEALAVLLAEETRIGMLVGVAVGWALAEELGG